MTVGVWVTVGVRVGVKVGVAVGVLVAVTVGVTVGVLVTVGVGPAGVAVRVGVTVDVLVGVGVAVLVAVAVGVTVRVGEGVAVGVGVGGGAASVMVNVVQLSVGFKSTSSETTPATFVITAPGVIGAKTFRPITALAPLAIVAIEHITVLAFTSTLLHPEIPAYVTPGGRMSVTMTFVTTLPVVFVNVMLYVNAEPAGTDPGAVSIEIESVGGF